MNQDVSETCIPPINAQRLGVENFLCSWVIGQNTDRFGKHLRSVEDFKQNPRYQGGGFPVAEHFNLPEHNHVQDMRVSVVRQVKGGTATRQREERRLIFQLGTLAPGDLNIDFKFL